MIIGKGVRRPRLHRVAANINILNSFKTASMVFQLPCTTLNDSPEQLHQYLSHEGREIFLVLPFF
ncbi:hypothetical protein HF325_004616 [Metschnikowia pulcherrima]|uniref:Uncharacterized protein n=1 Tax=Metschnikowia pulcherrima TaxID=27326 RepID=A0A8H7GPR7_9ASCO|nr:hypothetical protein HF325_004616 [Metschnikowia pulcherrima]